MRGIYRAAWDENDSAPALLWALRVKHPGPKMDFIRNLLEIKADVNIPDSNGYQPITWASVSENRVDFLNLFIEHGADVNVRTKERLKEEERPSGNRSPLHDACRHGNIPGARILIQQGLSFQDKTQRKETALHVAAFTKGNTEMIKVLIDMNANINAIDELGFTPLSLAVERADLAVVQVLLKAGATTNIGYSPLCIASRHPASDESSDFIRALVEANAKLDQRDEEGQSPLMVAFNGEITKLLVDLNANLEDQDHLGRTALFLAKTNSLKLILDANADIEHRDGVGLSALMFHAKNSNAEACEILLEAKADVNAKDANGNTTMELLNKEEDRLFTTLENMTRQNIRQIFESAIAASSV